MGSRLSNEPEDRDFRQASYALLLDGRLPTSSYRNLKGVRALTGHLRLDFILVERDGQFYDLVIRQLGDLVHLVYSDELCLLLMVEHD